MQQHVIIDVSDAIFNREPYSDQITAGIDVSGLGRTIIRSDGTTEITDTINNIIKIQPTSLTATNTTTPNIVTISGETIFADSSDNTGLIITKHQRENNGDANGTSETDGFGFNTGNIIIREAGNCSRDNGIGGTIQFEASPNTDTTSITKCCQIALTHEGIVGEDTWGLKFNLIGHNSYSGTGKKNYEILKLSGKDRVGICGKDPERNLDVSGTFRVINAFDSDDSKSAYLDIDNTGNIDISGNLDINGNIGIGLIGSSNTAEENLHIYTTDNDNGATILLQSDGGNGGIPKSMILFKTSAQAVDSNYSTYTSAKIISSWHSDSNSWNDSYIALQTHGNDDENFTNDLVIRGGKIGIGKDNPEHKLDVDGTIKVPQNQLRDGDNIGGVIPPGGIIMWSGSEVPDGWALCDGSNNTPDLRNRFILGSDIGANNSTGGSHSITLTTDQIPAHSHSASSGNQTANHSHGANAAREYSCNRVWSSNCSSGNIQGARNSNWNTGGNSANHSHGITVGDTGGGESFDNRPAYYTLAFIMKK